MSGRLRGRNGSRGTSRIRPDRRAIYPLNRRPNPVDQWTDSTTLYARIRTLLVSSLGGSVTHDRGLDLGRFDGTSRELSEIRRTWSIDGTLQLQAVGLRDDTLQLRYCPCSDRATKLSDVCSVTNKAAWVVMLQIKITRTWVQWEPKVNLFFKLGSCR